LSSAGIVLRPDLLLPVISVVVYHSVMICSRCKQSKPKDEFYNNRAQGARGKTHYCKTCQSAYSAEYYQKTKATKRKAYLEDNKEIVKHRRRSHYLRSTFGITVEQYDEMHETQNGLCLVCGEPETAVDNRNQNKIRRLAVDHCHTTGKVRGLLCQRCNMGIGYFRDNPVLLRAAADYAESHAPPGEPA